VDLSFSAFRAIEERIGLQEVEQVFSLPEEWACPNEGRPRCKRGAWRMLMSPHPNSGEGQKTCRKNSSLIPLI
jgi:hypothetical protein